MGNIPASLKSEIVRIAKQVAAEENKALRAQIAALKAQIEGTKAKGGKSTKAAKKLTTKAAASKKGTASKPKGSDLPEIKFTTALFRQRRKELGLSQSDFGVILGLSANGVSNLEVREGSVPRQRATLEAFASTEGWSPKKAQARVNVLKAKAK